MSTTTTTTTASNTGVSGLTELPHEVLKARPAGRDAQRQREHRARLPSGSSYPSSCVPNAFQRHQHYIQNYVLFYGGSKALEQFRPTPGRTDIDLLRETHKHVIMPPARDSIICSNGDVNATNGIGSCSGSFEMRRRGTREERVKHHTADHEAMMVRASRTKRGWRASTTIGSSRSTPSPTSRTIALARFESISSSLSSNRTETNRIIGCGEIHETKPTHTDSPSMCRLDCDGAPRRK